MPLPTGGPANGPSLLPALLLGLIVLGALAYYAWRRRLSRRALEARVAELAQLAEIGRALSDAPLDLGRLAQAVHRQTQKIAAADMFQLGLFEADRYRLLLWIVDGAPRPPAEFRLPPDAAGIVGWVRDERRSLLVRDFEAERDSLPARPRYQSPDPPRSGIFLPLITGETVSGCLVLQSRARAAFTEQQAQLLSIVAQYAAAALKNARALEQAQRQATRLELLARVSQHVNALQPLPDLYREVVGLVAAHFAEYTVAYYELADERLHLRAASQPEPPGHETTVPLGENAVGAAALSVRPVLAQELPDLPVDPAAGQPAVPAPGPPATLAVPVEIDGRVLGVLEARSRAHAAFDETASALFKALAGQMAIAILEARMYAAEQRRSEQLAAIARASRAITSALELDALLGRVLALAAEDEAFGYERARIYLLREEALVCAASTRPEEVTRFEDWEPHGPHYPLKGAGRPAQAARQRQPLCAADLAAEPSAQADPYLAGVRGWMAAPMRVGTVLLGVFEALSSRPDAFGPADLQTLQTLADTLGVAVRNAGLFAAERRRRQLAETLREVSTALTATLELNDVLDLILDGLARAVPHDTASILLTDEAGQLRLQAARGAPAAQAALGQRLDVRLYPPGEDLPATIPFAEVDYWGEYHTLLSIPEPHACLGAVLALDGQHLGYLVLDRAGQERYAPDEVELAAAFAAQAAVAIGNARLYAREREQAWVSASLLQVAEALAREPGLGAGAAEAARLTLNLAGADKVAIFQGNESGMRLAQAAGLAAPDEATLRAARLTPRELGLDPDPPGRPPGPPALPVALRRIFAPASCLVWALRARAGLLGALLVEPAADLPEERLRVLSGIAHELAVALENAQLAQEAAARERLERELEVARDIQASFLPRACPLAPGWQVSAYWQSARQVGGDFYDFIPLRPGAHGARWGLVIADVADKGVPAALYMALARTLLRTMAISLVSPALTLQRVNHLIQADSSSEIFVTVFYAVWEPATGRLRYATAGHPLPMRLDAGGQPQPVPGQGALLGVFEELEFEEQEICIEPGEALLLYTDGLPDAVNAAHEEFGLGRMSSALASSHQRGADAARQALTEAVQAHVGALEAFDDITLVVVKRLADDGESP